MGIIEIENEISKVKKELSEIRGTPCEVYARIVGYYRNVRRWNKGKQEEFAKRKMFGVNYGN